MKRIRLFVLAAGVAIVALTGHSGQKEIQFKLKVRLSPEWFRLTPESPEGVRRRALPLPEVTTDFYGRPRDPNHPSMGAIEYTDPEEIRAFIEREIAKRTGGK